MKAGIRIALVLYVIGVVLFILNVKTEQPPKPAPVVARPKPVSPSLQTGAIVRLHLADSDSFICSGVVVSDRHILTAAHCVVGMFSYFKLNAINGELRVKTEVLGINPRMDYAILVGDFTEFKKMSAEHRPEPIIKAVLDQSRKFLACGYPFGGDLFCTPITERRQSFFQIAGQGFLYPGMSGGPVIDTTTGIVMGVNSSVDSHEVQFSPLIEIYTSIAK